MIRNENFFFLLYYQTFGGGGGWVSSMIARSETLDFGPLKSVTHLIQTFVYGIIFKILE